MASVTRTGRPTDAAEPGAEAQALRADQEPTATEIAQKRARSREYVRQWRARPENRKKECLRAAGTKWNRKIERLKLESRVGAGEKCAYCELDAVTRVKRKRMTADGFVVVEVPYCGSC